MTSLHIFWMFTCAKVLHRSLEFPSTLLMQSTMAYFFPPKPIALKLMSHLCGLLWNNSSQQFLIYNQIKVNINASMHCHRCMCGLCSMLILKNSWVSDDCQRKVTRPWSWRTFHSASRGGSFFNWIGIAVNKPWAFKHNLCIFNEEAISKAMLALENPSPATVLNTESPHTLDIFLIWY